MHRKCHNNDAKNSIIIDRDRTSSPFPPLAKILLTAAGIDDIPHLMTVSLTK